MKYPANNSSKIWVSVTHTSNTPSNSGIQRVVRKLSAELINQYDNIEFIRWNKKRKEYFPVDPNLKTCRFEEYGGPDHSTINQSWDVDDIQNGRTCFYYLGRSLGFFTRRCKLSLDALLNTQQKNWLLLPELMTEKEANSIFDYAKKRQLKIATIFYDAIPVNHPEWVNERIRENHRGYMRAISKSDLIIPISKNSGNDFATFCVNENIAIPKIVPCLLAGDPQKVRPTNTTSPSIQNPIKILCVGTLEERKNHRNLLKAFEIVYKDYKNLSLTLVGSEYQGAPGIKEMVEEKMAQNSNLFWLSKVSDKELFDLYNECSFTIFPSLDEGFGLPIIESLWYGKACISANHGVMNELARDGGCLTTDVASPESIADSIRSLIDDRDLLKKLSQEANQRAIRTWHEYASEVYEILIAENH